MMKYFFLVTIFLYSTVSYSNNQTNSIDVDKQINSPVLSDSPEKTQVFQLSSDELYKLQKLKIQKDLEDKITEWFKQRFWFIAGITLVVGIFGIRSLVRELVSSEIKEAMRATSDALSAADSARESIKKVQSEAERYENLVELASTTADQVNNKLAELSTRIESEGERSIAAADLKVSSLNKQIQEIQKMIANLSQNSESQKEEIEKSKIILEQTRREAKTSEIKFTENSHVNVLFVPFSNPQSQEISENIESKLISDGFKTSHAPWSKNHSQSDGGIEITHTKDSKLYASHILAKISDLQKELGLNGPIRLKEKIKPVSGSDSKIVLFFT